MARSVDIASARQLSLQGVLVPMELVGVLVLDSLNVSSYCLMDTAPMERRVLEGR